MRACHPGGRGEQPTAHSARCQNCSSSCLSVGLVANERTPWRSSCLHPILSVTASPAPGPLVWLARLQLRPIVARAREQCVDCPSPYKVGIARVFPASCAIVCVPGPWLLQSLRTRLPLPRMVMVTPLLHSHFGFEHCRNSSYLPPLHDIFCSTWHNGSKWLVFPRLDGAGCCRASCGSSWIAGACVECACEA